MKRDPEGMVEEAKGKEDNPEDNPWLKSAVELRNGVVVGATLVAALAFQSGLAPPGGFWQDDKEGHTAGDPIWRDKNRLLYQRVQICNCVAFALSGITILLTMWSVIKSKRGKQLFLAYLAFSFSLGLMLGTLITSVYGR